jgi:hypothetical protein
VSPRKLQNEIKQDFRTDGSVWSSYKDLIVSEFAQINYQDLSDHLLREFNRKIINLGLSEDLMFSPFDSGYRFIGDTISAPAGPDAAYIAALTAAGATVTAPQQAAISTFISDEIAAGRWDGIKRLYFPVWGVAAANAICMKSLTSCTFNGAVTHGAGYIQGGDGKNITLGTTLAELGLSASSHYFAGLLKTPPNQYETLLDSNINISAGEENLRVRVGGLTVVDDDSILPENLFGVISYGGQTTLASRYCKLRKATGVTSATVQGGTVTGSLGTTPIRFLGTSSDSSGGWNGQCGALVLGTYLSAADDSAYTLNLQNLYNRILFGYITGLDWQNYADETIAYVIELNKAGVAYA